MKTLSKLYLLALTIVINAQIDPLCDPLNVDASQFITIHIGQATMEETPQEAQVENNNDREGDDRAIYWIHGLAGDANGWSVVATDTKANYEVEVSYSMDYSEISSGIFEAGNQLHSEMILNNRPEADKCGYHDDFIIAHSQGGIVARAMDYQMQTQDDKRKFGGIVTFGSPHLGAAILDNVEFAFDWIDNGCAAMLKGPVTELVESKWYLDLFFNNVDVQIDKLCELAAHQFIPRAFFSKHLEPIAQGLKVNSPALGTLNAFPSCTDNRVAFYGTEDQDAVLWRLLDSQFLNEAGNMPAFTADEDNEMVELFADALMDYESSSLEFETYYGYCVEATPTGQDWLGSCNDLNKVQDAYEEGAQWLRDANENYQIFIGALVTESVATSPNFGNCHCVDDSQLNATLDFPATSDECYDFDNYQCWMEYEDAFNVATVIKPNDGVVLAESAMAYSGAATEVMPGSNHFQMRNDPNTLDLRTRLLVDEEFGDYYRTPEIE